MEITDVVAARPRVKMNPFLSIQSGGEARMATARRLGTSTNEMAVQISCR